MARGSVGALKLCQRERRTTAAALHGVNAPGKLCRAKRGQVFGGSLFKGGAQDPLHGAALVGLRLIKQGFRQPVFIEVCGKGHEPRLVPGVSRERIHTVEKEGKTRSQQCMRCVHSASLRIRGKKASSRQERNAYKMKFKLEAPEFSPLAPGILEQFAKAEANGTRGNSLVAGFVDASKGRPQARFVPRRGVVSTGPGRPAMPPGSAGATVAVNLGLLLVGDRIAEWTYRFREDAQVQPKPGTISMQHKQELMGVTDAFLAPLPQPMTQTLRNGVKTRARRHTKSSEGRFRIFGWTRARLGTTLPL